MLILSGCTTLSLGTPQEPAPSKIAGHQKAAKPATASYEHTLRQANQLLDAGQIGPAATLYRRIAAHDVRNPTVVEASLRLAEIQLTQGEMAKAEALLIEASQQVPHPAAWPSLLLLGDIRASLGKTQAAWTAWGKVVRAKVPQAYEAWTRLLESYFQAGTEVTTSEWIAYVPPLPLTVQQSAALFQAAGLQDLVRLQALADFQPPGSLLAPFIALALGDATIRSGDEAKARLLWTKAAQDPATQDEAQRRLSPAKTDTPVKVGLLLPLSGRHQALGVNLLHAAQQALTDNRDVTITLQVADSQGMAGASQEAMQKLAGQGVQIVVGPVFHEEAQAAARVAVSRDMPIITLSPHPDIGTLGKAVYMNAFHLVTQAQFMARYAVEQGQFKRIAILAPDTDSGRLLAKVFAQEVTKLGGKTIRQAFFPGKTTDFSPWIKALVHMDPKDANLRHATGQESQPLDPVDVPPLASAKKLEPWVDFDALFLPAQAAEVRLIASQAALFKIRSADVALLGTALWNRPELLNDGTDFLQGAIFCDTDQGARDRFRVAYQQFWEEKPSTVAMLVYDSVSLIAQSLREERLGGAPWRQGLTQSRGIMGAAGRVRLLENGFPQRDYQLFQIAEQGMTSLYPAISPEKKQNWQARFPFSARLQEQTARESESNHSIRKEKITPNFYENRQIPTDVVPEQR